MSEEVKKIELPLQAVGQAPQEVQEVQEEDSEQKAIDAADFACGYFAGITHDGVFQFVAMGKNASLPELVSVHAGAGAHLKKSEIIGHHNEMDGIRKMLQFMNGNMLRLSGQLDALEKNKPAE